MYTTSGDKTQARVVYDMVTRMINANPTLKQYARTMKQCIEFRNPETGAYAGVFRPLTKTAANKHGLNTHVLVNDELHAHKTPELIDAMETSMGARTQPLILNITTSDFDRPDSVCNQKQDYARKVRDRILDDPAFLPVLYEATKEDDWKDRNVWRRVNPNLGRSFTIDFLEAEFRKAIENPAFENTFKRLYLNLRTEQSVRLINMESWDDIDAGVDPVAWRAEMEERFRGKQCHAGLDIGSTGDLSALARVFQDKGEWYVLVDLWITEQRVANRRTRANRTVDIDYSAWVNHGFIRTTPGVTTDYEAMRSDIRAINKLTPFVDLAIDTKFQGLQIAQQLNGDDGIEVFAFSQGFKEMTAPVRFMLELILNGRFHHGRNPVLRWMASCVAGYEREDGLRIDKQKSGGKVDGMTAAAMAIGRAMLTTTTRSSVYEGRGLLTLEF